jgi:hypothetical protein
VLNETPEKETVMLTIALVVGGLVAYGVVGGGLVLALFVATVNLDSDLRKLERRRDRLKQGILD